ncbi:YncE family protein [Nocardia sp. NPDC055321]
MHEADEQGSSGNTAPQEPPAATQGDLDEFAPKVAAREPVYRRRAAILASVAVAATVVVGYAVAGNDNSTGATENGMLTPQESPATTQVSPAEARTTITISEGPRGGRIILDPEGDILYVFTYDPSGQAILSVVDLESRSVVSTLPLPIPLPDGPRDVALDSAANTFHLLWGDPTRVDEQFVSIVDIPSMTITATVPVDKDAMEIDVDENSHTAYVLNCNRSCRMVYDLPGSPSTLTVIPAGATTANPPIPFSEEASDFVLDPRGQRAFVLAERGVTLHIVDMVTNAVIAEVPAAAPTSQFFFDDRSRTLYGSSWRWNPVVLTDVDALTSRKIANPATFGGSPYAPESQAVDPATRTFYMAIGPKNMVVALDSDTGALIDTVTVSDPSAVAVDPNTHALYIYGRGTLSIIDRPATR